MGESFNKTTRNCLRGASAPQYSRTGSSQAMLKVIVLFFEGMNIKRNASELVFGNGEVKADESIVGGTKSEPTKVGDASGPGVNDSEMWTLHCRVQELKDVKHLEDHATFSRPDGSYRYVAQIMPTEPANCSVAGECEGSITTTSGDLFAEEINCREKAVNERRGRWEASEKGFSDVTQKLEKLKLFPCKELGA